jgi:chromosome segregation and condensation protein ScpB
MFNLFKKDKSSDLSKHIKNLTKEIDNDGTAIAVCGSFANFLTNDELFKSLGVFNESKLPHSKSKLMLAAILLLKDIKNPPNFVTNEDLEYMNAIAKASFVYSSSAVSDSQLAELLLMPSSNALEAIRELKQPYEAVWGEWLTTDIDIESLTTTVLNKL